MAVNKTKPTEASVAAFVDALKVLEELIVNSVAAKRASQASV